MAANPAIPHPNTNTVAGLMFPAALITDFELLGK